MDGRMIDPQSPRSWPATAYQNALPNGVAHGRIAVDRDDLVFSAGSVPPLRLPLDSLELRYGGFNSQQAFLSHPRLPEWTFLCADPAFLRDDVIRLHPVHGKGAKQTHRATKKWPWPVKVMLVTTALFIAGVTTLWIYRSEIADSIASNIPVSSEEKLGAMVYAQIRASTKEVTDPAMVAQLKAVTDRLVPAVDDTRYTFKFHIVENDTINAFALPGGHIVVHSALLKKAKSPEEIAGVLAHEICHITHRHSMRSMVSGLGTTVIIRALFGDYAVLAEGASTLLNQKYSQDIENEADATGWKYLIAAKIDPQGMIDLFQTLLDEEKEMGLEANGATDVISSHPAIADRIAALSKLRKEVPAGTVFEPIVIPPPAAVPTSTP